jgi:hypothetical protein
MKEDLFLHIRKSFVEQGHQVFIEDDWCYDDLQSFEDPKDEEESRN